MRRKTEQTDQFAVTDDAGNVDMAFELTDFLLDEGGGQRKWIAGLKEFQLSNGDKLNRIDDDTYQWVRRGVQLRRMQN